MTQNKTKQSKFMQSHLAILKRVFTARQIASWVLLVTTQFFPVSENMVQQKCYVTRKRKIPLPHHLTNGHWSSLMYPLVASYNLLDEQLHYSGPNEEQVTLPGWTLDKMQFLTSSLPALGFNMIAVFREARERFNVNGDRNRWAEDKSLT